MACSYVYRCENDHTMIEAYPIGTAPRSVECPRCTTPMQLMIGHGVQIAKSALESKGEAVRNQIAMEKANDRDLPAYARLRKSGLRPTAVHGAADVEQRVEDQFDIDYGDIVPSEKKSSVKQQLADAQLVNMGVK